MPTLHDLDLRNVVQMLPADVRDLIKQHGFALAGGSLRARIGGEPVSDFDLYAPEALTEEQIQRIVVTFADARHAVVVRTGNAWTVVTVGRTPVQIVTRWRLRTPDDLIARFDFTVARAVVWHRDGRWRSLIGDDFYADLAARRLTYTNPIDPEVGASVLRARKFLRRGWQLPVDALADLVVRLALECDQVRERIDEAHLRSVVRAKLFEVDPLNIVDGVEVTRADADELVLNEGGNR